MNKSKKPQLGESNVSSSAISETHEKWLVKFNKKREGKMMNLKYEYEDLNSPLSNKGRPNLKSYCANALWIAIKGTKMEKDGKFFVELLEPKFFSDVD